MLQIVTLPAKCKKFCKLITFTKKFTKHYTDYLSYSNTSTFFLTPADKNEISLISSLDSYKSSGPNSIP